MAITYFVQNLTAPVESDFVLGIRQDADNVAGALAEFRAAHEPAPEDILCVVDANDLKLFELVEQPPAPVSIPLSEIELPEEGS